MTWRSTNRRARDSLKHEWQEIHVDNAYVRFALSLFLGLGQQIIDDQKKERKKESNARNLLSLQTAAAVAFIHFSVSFLTPYARHSSFVYSHFTVEKHLTKYHAPREN